jgi:hypothetical protein
LYGATVAFTKSCSAFTIASSPECGARSTTNALTSARSSARDAGDGAPAALHVVGMARVVEVAAAGAALHRQAADRAGGHAVAVLVGNPGAAY